MKKILPYIFVFLIIVNLFAPFGVGMQSGRPTVITQKAEANSIILTTSPRKNNTSITVDVVVTWANEKAGSTLREGVQVSISGPGIQPLSKVIDKWEDVPATPNTQKGTVIFGDLQPSTTYTVETIARQIGTVNFTLSNGLSWNFNSLWGQTPETVAAAIDQGSLTQTAHTDSITTEATGQATNVAVDSRTTIGTDVFMPTCGVTTLGGCVAQIFYYVLFVPSSYLLALTGTFFDFSFNYSVQDTSYRNPFVVQGWGIVRDFCNMFFIFVLLYIAFATILNVHGFNTKTMIVNVVIIGLFINFSLFTTQIIIDASNILARVFYNPETITITQGSIGSSATSVTTKTGSNGEIPLSAALVNKINPQNLIINGRNSIQITDPVSGQRSTSQSKNNIGTGTFILITLLATAVNIIGMIVFLSVGMVFIGRVVGLWFAMIFSPLVFFSYTVPQMENMDMIGRKKWWPETLKLAFLAPVFIFFLYLIIQFLQKGLGIFATQGLEGMEFIISIIIPFAFIMVLLMKAKGIAKDMSNSIGQSVTGAVAAAGGLALGGAALGAAAVGRGLITNPMKMMQSSQATRSAALKNFNVLKPSTYGKAVSAKMANLTIGKPKVITNPDGTTKTVEGSNKLRDKLLSLKKDKGEKTHAEHALNDQADKIQKGAKFSELSAPDQAKAKAAVNKEEVSKFLFNKAADKLDSTQLGVLGKVLSADGEVVQAELQKYAASFNKDYNKFHDAEHMENVYNKPSNDIVGKALTGTVGGSYDIRNINTKGIMAPIALALRTSLKNSGINVGKAQNDLFKDLGHTIKEAVKSVKVDVKVDSHDAGGHDDHAHDDHGGGHH